MVCVAVDHYFPPFSESCALRMMMASVVSGSGGPRKGATATKKRAEQILWSKEEETTPCYFPSEPETFLRRTWQLQKNGDFTLASMAICPSYHASPAKIFNQLDTFI
ncbi:unnamed protein product [Linum tenue]|uniref:Uncharacterized protein n=1 Tax=Linum tenue TaxID=586396 RepID=A0AAV0MS12_9ROSI|nr:unnamed protein product [Linum tenue]